MPYDPHSLFGNSKIATIVSQSSNTLVVTLPAGDGAMFFINQQIVLCQAGQQPTFQNAMIARITAISGDRITLDYSSPNREGSSVRSVVIGDQFGNNITPKLFTDLEANKVEITTTVNGHALNGNIVLSASDIGLGSVTNDAQVKRTEMGTASGVATLDSSGLVNANQLRHFFLDARDYGAKVDGTTDDKTAIQTALNAASSGGFVILPGLSALSGSITIPGKAVLVGVGPGSGVKLLAGFTDAQAILFNSDLAGVRDIRIFGGPNTASATNPAITAAIAITSARFPTIQNVRFYYVNGWSIESIGGATINNVGGFIDKVHFNHVAKGIHIKGDPGSNYVGQYFMSNIHVEAIDSDDALFLEDINDMEVVNINGAVAGGSVVGSMIHIKGNSNSIFFSNIDLGALAQATVSPTILIEAGANGSPSNVTMVGGVVQKGAISMLQTAGTDIKFTSIKFKSPNTDNIQITGGAPATFEDCQFGSGNQSGGTGYDVHLTISTGFAYFRNCIFQSPVGAGGVTNPVNDANHRGYFVNCHFAGTGNTPSTVFASGATPQIVRNCPGYNPRGSITPPAITASPFTGNSSQHDVTIYFTALNDMTDFKIGGISIGAIPVVGVGYHLPARQAFQIEYTTTPPTYVWFAD